MLRYYDYNMHVEGLLSANLCLVTVLIPEQCSQFEIFRLQPVKMANKTVAKLNRLAVMPRRAELIAICFDV